MLRLLLAAAALLFVTCAAPEPTLYTAEGTPIVGRLQLRDETIDLTMRAFGTAPHHVDPNANAEIIADIDLDHSTPRSGLERAR
jgi:hypothetical protein